MGNKACRRRKQRMFYAGVMVAPLLVSISVLRFVSAVYGVSLDDAYIFFVYARNLANGQGWSFNPGQTSFGTSSPLWTLLLCIPAAFGIDLVQASRILGGLSCAGSAGLISLIVWELVEDTITSLLPALVFATTTSVVLISVTGMDVASHTLLLLLIAYVTARRGVDRPLLMGVLSGLFFLSRSDAIIAIPVLSIAWIIVEMCSGSSLRGLVPMIRRHWVLLIAAALITVLPWQLFLFSRTGRLVPTTYYAKLLSMPGAPETLSYTPLQRARTAAEYAWDGLGWILTKNGIFISVTLIVLAGLWVIGHLVRPAESSQTQSKHHMVAYLFMFGFLVLLPLEYGVQTPWWYGGYLHRYVLPVLPLALILTFVGLHHILVAIGLRPDRRHEWNQLLGLRGNQSAWYAGQVVTGLLALAVIGHGVSFSVALPAEIENYRVIVGFNEGYRRSVAEWLRLNTPPDARIGENFLGVGVLGYYADRYIVDAGGLADSEILSYWAADGDPRATGAETLQFFDAKGVSYMTGGSGLETSLEERVILAATIRNRTGDLVWSGTDFNTTVIYQYSGKR